MREIALHILDIARNSIEAGATAIELTVVEDRPSDRLEIVIKDNGTGMDALDAQRATDPFFSTRTTRRVGLGLALLEATCRRCDGHLQVRSKVGDGTTVHATLTLGHLDRPPLGDMGAVIQALACESDRTSLHYRHVADGRTFEFDSQEAQDELGPARLTDPVVLHELGEYVNRELRKLRAKG